MSQGKPALTREEWQNRYCTKEGVAMAAAPGQPYLSAGDDAVHDDGFDAGPEARHALAALSLYGQPFGFTREDVNLLRYAAGVCIADRELNGLADRIEALLPPEKP